MVVTWRAPEGEGEDEVVCCNGFRLTGLEPRHRPTSSRGEHRYEQLAVSRHHATSADFGHLLNYTVIRYRGSVPSAAAGMHVFLEGRQEEDLDLLFRAGVAPNWTAWGNAAPREATRRITHRSPVQKTRYQVIAGSGPAFDGGVYREFLGLEPGKTYRVSVRVNSLEMDKVEGEWSYAVYAAPNGPGGAPLTEDQLAGRAPLPSGARADECARIVEYTRATHTDAEWVKVSTADAKLPGKTTGNITLPPGVTALTVWLRHKGRGVASTGVGMDWIALEELPQ